MKKLFEKIMENRLEIMTRMLEVFGVICIIVGAVWSLILDIKFNLPAQYLFEEFALMFLPGLLVIFASVILINRKHVTALALIVSSQCLILVNVILNFVFKNNDKKYIAGLNKNKGNNGLYNMNNVFSIITLVIGFIVVACFVYYYIIERKDDEKAEVERIDAEEQQEKKEEKKA